MIVRKAIYCKMGGESVGESLVDNCLEWKHKLLMRLLLLRSWRIIAFYNFQAPHAVYKEAM